MNGRDWRQSLRDAMPWVIFYGSLTVAATSVVALIIGVWR